MIKEINRILIEIRYKLKEQTKVYLDTDSSLSKKNILIYTSQIFILKQLLKDDDEIMIDKINEMLANAILKLNRYQKDYYTNKVQELESKVIFYESQIYTLQQLLEYEKKINKTI